MLKFEFCSKLKVKERSLGKDRKSATQADIVFLTLFFFVVSELQRGKTYYKMTNAAAVPCPNTAKQAYDLIRVDNADTDGLVDEWRNLMADSTTCLQNSVRCICVRVHHFLRVCKAI